MNKQWRSIFLLTSILVLGIVLLWWFVWQKTPEKPEIPAQIVQESRSYEVQPRKNLREKRSFHFFDTFVPIVKPFERLMENITTPLNPPSSNPSQPPLTLRGGDENDKISSPLNVRGARGVMEKPLSSSDPVFKKLYPDYYLNALSIMHRIMVNDGFLPDTSLDIPDEEALFAFLGTTIDYAETKNFIARTDAERFRKALHGETREFLRKERYSFLDKILDYLKISKAFANILTYCYADPYPFNIIPGVNLPLAFCCNCGLICPKVGPPVFVPYCSSIKKCDVPLGCLNLFCPYGNAIWDLSTGICGCDNPVSAAINIPSILKNALNCIAPKQPAPPIPPTPPSTP